jgi:hypothetical protein
MSCESNLAMYLFRNFDLSRPSPPRHGEQVATASRLAPSPVHPLKSALGASGMAARAIIRSVRTLASLL